MKKRILTFLMAFVIFVLPQTVCFAAAPMANEVASTNLSPTLIIESYSVDKSSVNPGDVFKLNFKLKNTSKNIKAQNILIRLSGGEMFSVYNSTDTIYTEAISQNSTYSLSKSFYCSPSAESGVYPISVAISYEYFDGGEKLTATAESTMAVKVVKNSSSQTSGKTPSLTPQLLISSFTYGGATIEGGSKFDLNFSMKNNSSDIPVENVIVKLSGGESFVVADGTDTIAIKQIAKGASVSVKKSFQSLKTASSGVYPIVASISYEYFDGGEKATGSSELTMSIPVIQSDRVRFEAISLADKTVTIDQENDCGFKIINSGQTKLSSGTVRLLDADKNELVSAYVGNIEPGMMFESNYTLPITFKEEGLVTLTLVFEYENENLEKKSIEQTFNTKAEKENDPFAEIDKNKKDEKEKDKTGLYIGLSVGGIVVIIVGAIVLKKVIKKRKNKKGSEVFDEEI